MTDDATQPPEGIGDRALALWREVLGTFELMPQEVAVLRETVRVVDRLERLDQAVQEDGAMVDGRPHPAMVEARQQQIILGRLLTTLRLPEDWESVESRPQQRGGSRGAYQPREMRVVQ